MEVTKCRLDIIFVEIESVLSVYEGYKLTITLSCDLYVSKMQYSVHDVKTPTHSTVDGLRVRQLVFATSLE